MPRVHSDYDELAHNFARTRDLTPDKREQWAQLLQRHLELDARSSVLDVGCGTGRFAELMCRASHARVVGIDPSGAMLGYANSARLPGIQLLQGYGEYLPLKDASFDACLASQVLHHFSDCARAIQEIARVLKNGGKLGIRCSSHAQLRKFIDYRFFPTALKLDLQRVPDIEFVKDRLAAGGLVPETELVVLQVLAQTGQEYIEKVRSHYASGLALIARAEFIDGLSRAQRLFETNGFDQKDLLAEITFLVARKT